MWALHKHFPNVKIYVRAHDVMHGLNLEKVRTQTRSRVCSVSQWLKTAGCMNQGLARQTVSSISLMHGRPFNCACIASAASQSAVSRFACCLSCFWLRERV